MTPRRQDAVDVVQLTARDLLAYFERRTTSVEDAADLLGETLLVAWRRIDALPADPERARMWLFVTARHVLANDRRSVRRRSALTERLRESLLAHRPATPAASDETADVVREAVAALPAHQRELVALVHWDGFSLVEAAEITGVSASTARSRYAAARAALRAVLAPGALPAAALEARPS